MFVGLKTILIDRTSLKLYKVDEVDVFVPEEYLDIYGSDPISATFVQFKSGAVRVADEEVSTYAYATYVHPPFVVEAN